MRVIGPLSVGRQATIMATLASRKVQLLEVTW